MKNVFIFCVTALLLSNVVYASNGTDTTEAAEARAADNSSLAETLSNGPIILTLTKEFLVSNDVEEDGDNLKIPLPNSGSDISCFIEVNHSEAGSNVGIRAQDGARRVFLVGNSNSLLTRTWTSGSGVWLLKAVNEGPQRSTNSGPIIELQCKATTESFSTKQFEKALSSYFDVDFSR